MESNLGLNLSVANKIINYLGFFVRIASVRGDVDALKLQALTMLDRLKKSYLLYTDLPEINEMLRFVPEIRTSQQAGGCGGGGVIDDMLKKWAEQGLNVGRKRLGATNFGADEDLRRKVVALRRHMARHGADEELHRAAVALRAEAVRRGLLKKNHHGDAQLDFERAKELEAALSELEAGRALTAASSAPARRRTRKQRR